MYWQEPAYGAYKEKREALPEAQPEAAPAPADYGNYGAYGSYGRMSCRFLYNKALNWHMLQQNIKTTPQHQQLQPAARLALPPLDMAPTAVRYSTSISLIVHLVLTKKLAYGAYKEKREAAPEPEAAPADYGNYGTYGAYGRTSQLYPPIKMLFWHMRY